ncbi:MULTISPECIES: type VII secretion system-associated protein [unclassified Streptomyces]|uniref:type VII secretion system-associated protein n=1 Tax=unclassified Streptomyces TaxID=2593676 RepID=UPI0006F59674|nr:MULTISPECIES: type VII secretion system-associated protein [unclassified Streptomyces]KQX49511.1 hypothetical protein ASD33_17390 [Streptomyces sp. Root1304]KRA79130.1 hypothetical protein ASE09_21910 [Streptomyces sp. Root66D1]
MAEGTDLSHLDKEGLTRFLTVDGQGIPMFLKKLEEIASTSPTAPAPTMPLLARKLKFPGENITSQGPKLGRLALDDTKPESPAMGNLFVAYMQTNSEKLGEILTNQLKLFKEIKQELGFTIADMAQTEEDNLDSIEGQKVLEDWKDISDLISPKPAA